MLFLKKNAFHSAVEQLSTKKLHILLFNSLPEKTFRCWKSIPFVSSLFICYTLSWNSGHPVIPQQPFISGDVWDQLKSYSSLNNGYVLQHASDLSACDFCQFFHDGARISFESFNPSHSNVTSSLNTLSKAFPRTRLWAPVIAYKYFRRINTPDLSQATADIN